MAVRLALSTLSSTKVEIINCRTNKVEFVATSITKAGKWLGKLKNQGSVSKNLHSGKPINKNGIFYKLKEKL